jgi:hypothetical protein
MKRKRYAVRPRGCSGRAHSQAQFRLRLIKQEPDQTQGASESGFEPLVPFTGECAIWAHAQSQVRTGLPAGRVHAADAVAGERHLVQRFQIAESMGQAAASI